jgi:phosphate transport system permease protein
VKDAAAPELPTDADLAAGAGGRKARRATRKTNRDVNTGDRIFRGLTTFFAGLVVATLAAVAIQLVITAGPSLSRFGFHFLYTRDWNPVEDQFGALPFLYGTITSSLLALLIAVPIALGIAIFLTELAPPWMRSPVSFLVELLAAVPSVVYGLWGIFVMAPWLRDTVEPKISAVLGFIPLFRLPESGTTGLGMFTAGLILSIMILPTISSIAREVLRATPLPLREGALALGATRWEVVRFVILPYARSGIVGAVILGLGRALGETMAVTMVIGNSPDIFAPGYTMASIIANEFTEATGKIHLAALAEIGLLLFVVTFVLNVLARLLVWRVAAGPKGGRG